MGSQARGVVAVVGLGTALLLLACDSAQRHFLGAGGGATDISASGDAGSSPAAAAGGTAPSGGGGAEAGDSAGASGATGDEPIGGTTDAGGLAGAPDGPVSNDVTGLLFDVEGQPIVGAPIEVDGRIVTTDINGAFTVKNVPAKYDAVVVSELYKEVDTYDGLSTRTPHFTVSSQHLPTFSAKLRGGLSGGAGFPSPAGHLIAVTAIGSDRNATFKATVSGSGYTFASLDWGSPNTNAFTMGALQWSTGSNSLPVGYDGWGTTKLKLSNGADSGMTDGALPQYNIVLGPLASHTVSGMLTVPSGCKAAMQVQVGAIQIVYEALASNSFSYVLPIATPGAALHLNAICLYGGSQASAEVSLGLATEDTLAIIVPASPTVSLPVADATGVTSATQFSWLPGDGPLTMVRFFENAPENWSIYRFGTSNTTTFPDLVRFGIPFPKNLQVAWDVSSVSAGAGATGSTDDALAPSLVFVGRGERISIGQSAAGQSFTTAP